MKVNIENVFESKEKFHDEVIDRIVEAASKVADLIPASVFVGWTEEQIMEFWQNTQNFMVLGAGIALDYMKNKCKEEVINNQKNWFKWTERKPKDGDNVIVISTAFGGYEIAHFGKAAIGVVEKLREGDIEYLYWTYIPDK